MSVMKIVRQKRALERLERQLVAGVKQHNEPLTEEDRTRIHHEIRTLKERTN